MIVEGRGKEAQHLEDSLSTVWWEKLKQARLMVPNLWVMTPLGVIGQIFTLQFITVAIMVMEVSMG